MRINETIKAYREKTGFTLARVSKEIGILPMTLWRFEQGRPVESEVWARIIKWLLSQPSETKTKRN